MDQFPVLVQLNPHIDWQETLQLFLASSLIHELPPFPSFGQSQDPVAVQSLHPLKEQKDLVWSNCHLQQKFQKKGIGQLFLASSLTHGQPPSPSFGQILAMERSLCPLKQQQALVVANPHLEQEEIEWIFLASSLTHKLQPSPSFGHILGLEELLQLLAQQQVLLEVYPLLQ